MKALNATLDYLNILEDQAYSCFAFWSSVLVLKMLFMSLLAAMQRFRTKTFANVEDLAFSRGQELKFNNPDVERVRRAHRNDLENILPFLIIALIYLSLKPDTWLACWLFRIGALARIIHTIVYAFRPVPQPSRAISFFCNFCVTFYMAFHVLKCTFLFI